MALSNGTQADDLHERDGASGRHPADACRPLDRANDVLIVDTVGFLPGVLNAPVRRSDTLHVVERFTLDPKTMRVTRQYSAEDPIYLKGKYSGSDVIQVADASYTQEC